jgi:hypothetical protein
MVLKPFIVEAVVLEYLSSLHRFSKLAASFLREPRHVKQTPSAVRCKRILERNLSLSVANVVYFFGLLANDKRHKVYKKRCGQLVTRSLNVKNLKFVFPLQNVSDSALFNAITGVTVEVNKGKYKGLTGNEFAITLAVSFIASATYDSLKAIAQNIISGARDYSHATNPKSDNTKMNFNGLLYPISSEADLKILMFAVEAATKSGLEIDE